MPDAPITYELQGDVAVVRLDDGKANAIGPPSIEFLNEALTRAEGEAQALILLGREGRFSAGFDLSVMTSSVEAMQSLVSSGAELLLRLYGSPVTTVAACSGHALAMGALLLLASDSRIGADGPFKIGLNEVAIGMGLPIFAVELARDRVPSHLLSAATVNARVWDPAGAVGAGYLDRVVPAGDLEAAALEEANRLAQYQRGAVGHTKDRLRGATIERIRSTLAEDMGQTAGPRPGDAPSS